MMLCTGLIGYVHEAGVLNKVAHECTLVIVISSMFIFTLQRCMKESANEPSILGHTVHIPVTFLLEQTQSLVVNF